MKKLNKIIFDIQTKIKNNPGKHIIILYTLLIISIVL
jgi:hypothetical protein